MCVIPKVIKFIHIVALQKCIYLPVIGVVVVVGVAVVVVVGVVAVVVVVVVECTDRQADCARSCTTFSSIKKSGT